MGNLIMVHKKHQRTHFSYLGISILMQRKEMNEMEEKKEVSLPIWVWVVVIGIAAIIVVSLILFLE